MLGCLIFLSIHKFGTSTLRGTGALYRQDMATASLLNVRNGACANIQPAKGYSTLGTSCDSAAALMLSCYESLNLIIFQNPPRTGAHVLGDPQRPTNKALPLAGNSSPSGADPSSYTQGRTFLSLSSVQQTCNLRLYSALP